MSKQTLNAFYIEALIMKNGCRRITQIPHTHKPQIAFLQNTLVMIRYIVRLSLIHI